MKRVVILLLLGVLATPCVSSDPTVKRMERTKPTVSRDVPILQPRVTAPITPPEPLLNTDLMEKVLQPDLALVKEIAGRVGIYWSSPSWRMQRLLNQSEDFRQAREEWHRFWMNNQPSVLTYERLNGAIGP